MKTKIHLSVIALLAAAAAISSVGSARADMIINPSTQTPITDFFTAETGAGVTPGTAGYIGGELVAQAAGSYLFTYLGHGDSPAVNEFKVGTQFFCNQATTGGDCVGGPSTVGDSFTLTFTANESIPFSFLYQQASDGTGGHTLSNGTRDDTNGAYLAQLIGPGCTSSTIACASPSAPLAYLGLADLPYPTDHDFQDLTVSVREVAEPASLSIIGLGLFGIGWVRRRRRG